MDKWSGGGLRGWDEAKGGVAACEFGIPRYRDIVGAVLD